MTRRRRRSLSLSSLESDASSVAAAKIKKSTKKKAKSSSSTQARKDLASATPRKFTRKKSEAVGGSKPKGKKSKKKMMQSAPSSKTSNVAASSSSVGDKEVYASGDKILVSVNFKHSKKRSRRHGSKIKSPNKPDSSSSAAIERAKAQKPSLVIDIMSSPYQVFEASPKETIDIFSDAESSPVKVKDLTGDISLMGSTTVVPGTMSPDCTTPSDMRLHSQQQPSSTLLLQPQPPPQLQLQQLATSSSSTAVKTNGTAEDRFSGLSANDVVASTSANHHKGPMTPPGDEHETLDLANGPQTPISDIVNDCYDPCNPTAGSPDEQTSDQIKKVVKVQKDPPHLLNRMPQAVSRDPNSAGCNSRT
jgi:hypothetical protein